MSTTNRYYGQDRNGEHSDADEGNCLKMRSAEEADKSSYIAEDSKVVAVGRRPL
jgi:hypothetical protein